jgi:3-oxoacyl-[acyl-carrier protein] reductase
MAHFSELKAALGEQSERVLYLSYDVGDKQAVQSAAREIKGRFGTIHGLVNNAGVLGDGLLGMLSDTQLEETMRTNLYALMHHLQLAPRLMSKEGGSIVNLGSIIGERGNQGQVLYAASKAGVSGASKAAAKELAAKGIRVNTVSPGYIDTDMTKHLSPELQAKRLSEIPLGRAGRAQEVAELIVFLLSARSADITGQIIGVDGGMVL